MRPALAVALILLAAACDGDPARSSATPLDSTLAVNGTELFVHREGRGEPIIVIHGGPLLDHGYMVEPLRPLADRYTLVFYDQRLSGRSAGSVDSASVTIRNFAEDVDAVREALGYDRVHVLGHSWGGLIAMRYAIDHPDRVRSLILVSPMPPTTEMWQEAERVLAGSVQPEDTAGMGELRTSDAIRTGEPAAIEQLLRMSFRGQMYDPDAAASLRFRIADDYGLRSSQFGLLLPELVRYDVRNGLRELDVPVLIVYGAAEVGTAPAIAAFRDALPRAQIARVPLAGHFAFVERPGHFNQITGVFLNRLR